MPRLKHPHMASCHPDRPYRALDLCCACYFRQRRETIRVRRIALARLATLTRIAA